MLLFLFICITVTGIFVWKHLQRTPAMSVTNSQLVKWSFPALALIIGLFWYKRRRVDRVDPGGKSSLNKKAEGTNNTQKNTSNLYDSGIHIDESFSSNQNTEASSPRKRSESLDIPNRKLCSQSISIKSGKSSGDSQPWYGEDENTIVLGSKPQSSSFGMMARNKSLSLEIKEQTKSSKVFKHVAEEEEPISNVTTKKSLSNGIATGVKVADGISEDDKKMTRCQAISERDSANHSPVSGVLDGSVNDEVRSEGSTDSGKGDYKNNNYYVYSNIIQLLHQNILMFRDKQDVNKIYSQFFILMQMI